MTTQLHNPAKNEPKMWRKLPNGETPQRMESLRTRFWSRVLVQPPDECWPWIGHVNSQGYGKIKGFLKSTEYAHRVSYFLHAGTIDQTLKVLHSCDRPSCVNPRHLRQGTPRDNNQDCLKRGRNITFMGEAQSQAKLNADDVREIRKRYSASTSNQMQLSREFGVTQQLISLIIYRKKWAHVE